MSKNTTRHPLEVILGSRLRFKMLKFFFRNPTTRYTEREVTDMIQEPLVLVHRELIAFVSINLLRKGRAESQGDRARRIVGYMLNAEFEYSDELRDLILKSLPARINFMTERINALGRVRLAVISGILINKEVADPQTADLLVVGEDIDRRRFTNFLKALEAEVGKEIRFAVMDREEFKYRLAMFDRFIRVLLEGPHEKLINKMGI